MSVLEYDESIIRVEWYFTRHLTHNSICNSFAHEQKLIAFEVKMMNNKDHIARSNCFHDHCVN